MVREAEFQAGLLKALRMAGCVAFNNVQNARTGSGRPDIEFSYRGRMVFAELKVEPNKPTSRQVYTALALHQKGIDCLFMAIDDNAIVSVCNAERVDYHYFTGRGFRKSADKTQMLESVKSFFNVLNSIRIEW